MEVPMTLRAIKPSGAPGALASYSPAIDTGHLVFLAGQVGIDPATGQLVEGGIEAQVERVLRNISAVLDAAGLTMADVAKTTCFLADINDFDAFNAVYSRFVSEPPPARSTFAVKALPRGALVEIEAVAARP
jgi:2-iminobutanoate/2-iminopropanoate deaminase